jgi:hypothetical protein
VRWERADGTLNGLDEIREHFRRGLEAAPNLRFDLVDVLAGVGSAAILYRRETGALVSDIVQFDGDGKIASAEAVYSTPPGR